ncbi:hypothetical protein D3C86_1486800 [compost metagenome]
MAEIGRQQVLEAFDVTTDVQFTALDTLIQRGAFLHQQGAYDDYRHNRDDHAKEQGDECGEVSAEFQAHEQAALQRCEQDAENDRPEDGTVERYENPEKGERDQRQKQQQGSVLQRVLVHGRSWALKRRAKRCALKLSQLLG